MERHVMNFFSRSPPPSPPHQIKNVRNMSTNKISDFHNQYPVIDQAWSVKTMERFPDQILSQLINKVQEGDTDIDNPKWRILETFIKHLIKGCNQPHCKTLVERISTLKRKPEQITTPMNVTPHRAPETKRKYFSSLHDVEVTKITDSIQTASHSLQMCEDSLAQIDSQLSQCDHSLASLEKTLHNPMTKLYMEREPLEEPRDEKIRDMVKKEVKMVVSEIEDCKRKRSLLVNLQEHLKMRKSVLSHNIEHLKYVAMEKLNLLSNPMRDLTLEEVINVYTKYANKRKRQREEPEDLAQQHNEACDSLLSLAVNGLVHN